LKRLHLGQLREADRFESWVATIARRVALARQQDPRTLPLPIGLVDPTATRAGTGTEPLAADVQAALPKLPRARRRLLDLRY
jgi:DNA-directed RNA polymerase specialized sigma24 family protein